MIFAGTRPTGQTRVVAYESAVDSSHAFSVGSGAAEAGTATIAKADTALGAAEAVAETTADAQAMPVFKTAVVDAATMSKDQAPGTGAKARCRTGKGMAATATARSTTSWCPAP